MSVDDGCDIGVVVESVDESDTGIIDHDDGPEFQSVNDSRIEEVQYVRSCTSPRH